MDLDNEKGKGCAQREKGQGMMMMMKQMPRTLSHVIDVHHRVRRKLNIARRHINIYTPGLRCVDATIIFSPLIAGNRGARFVFASLSSIAISFSSSSSFSSFLFFFHATHNTARDPLRRHAVATGISELAEQTSADKSTGGIQYIWK